jgi:lipid-A-disaccharide synthase-like uncharacterized protein
VQWIKSERGRKSVFPIAFWYLSIAGGVTLLAYAIYRKDPVFIVGQLAWLFIYFRNLYFVVCSGQVFSDTKIGCSSAIFRSKALGGR